MDNVGSGNRFQYSDNLNMVMKTHYKLFSLILCAILGALIFALKICMAPLPNIEPVTLMLMLITLVFGARAFASASVYILLEGLVYGFSPWWLCYVYIWPLLIFLTLPLRKYRSRFLFSAVGGLFGFAFGFLFIPVFYFTYDLSGKLIPYIMADIPFDLIHAGANVIIVFCLLPPLRTAFERILGKYTAQSSLRSKARQNDLDTEGNEDADAARRRRTADKLH